MTTLETSKKMGRPSTPDYYKRLHRYVRIEKTIMAAIEKMDNDNDKKIILNALNELK